MMAALVAGQHDPTVLAQRAWTRMRAKLPQLQEAFVGRFEDHHGLLLGRMLARIDALGDIAQLKERIHAEIAPFDQAVARLDEIPGVGRTAAWMIIAEVGVDMTRFPHRCAPVLLGPVHTPGVKGVRRTQEGQRRPRPRQPVPGPGGEAAVSAGGTDTFLGARYRRIARRRGKKKATVAVGGSILVIVWYLLSNPDAHFVDLGPDYHHTRRSTERAVPHHIRQLPEPGYRVTLEPAA